MMLSSAMHRAELLKAASQLTDLGLYLLTCGPDKSPRHRNGFKAATTDLQKIIEWLSSGENTMLAARSGSISGFFVIDLDRDEAKNLNAISWLANMERQFGKLPAHPVARTPRGGRHHYFKYPQDREIKCSAGKITAGVDIRGDGGYVIVPPSVSPVGEYSWEVAPWEVQNV